MPFLAFTDMHTAVSLSLIRILLFALVPAGIYLLVIGIRLVQKGFNGKIVAEIPFTTGRGTFTLTQEGRYAIWQKAPLFRKTPVDVFKPLVTRQPSGVIVPLYASLSRSSTNDGSVGRMELFTFAAAAGDYTLELTEGSSISALESAASKAIPGRRVEAGQYFIEVRESPPAYYGIGGIVLLIAGALCTIGGFVAGLLADSIIG